jgi:predicted AAA+ superfamily ATPase
MEEVDFVIETLDGRAIPVEVKFRQTIEPRDVDSVRRFMARYRSPFGIVVTRDLFYCEEDEPVICVPVLDFLLAF